MKQEKFRANLRMISLFIEKARRASFNDKINEAAKAQIALELATLEAKRTEIKTLYNTSKGKDLLQQIKDINQEAETAEYKKALETTSAKSYKLSEISLESSLLKVKKRIQKKNPYNG